MTKLRIIKDTRYSSGRWRVVDESGEAITTPQAINHPDLGPQIVSMPLCRDSKAELIDEVLAIVQRQAETIQKLKTKLHAYKIGG
jgi:hypothetical protein